VTVVGSKAFSSSYHPHWPAGNDVKSKQKETKAEQLLVVQAVQHIMGEVSFAYNSSDCGAIPNTNLLIS